VLDSFAFGSGTSEHLLPTNISADEIEKNASFLNSKLLSFLVCFLGLQISYLSWGVIQERIIKHDYKSLLPSDEIQHDRFNSTQFLVLANRVAGLILSSLIMFIFSRQSFQNNKHLQKIVSSKHWAPLFICSYSSLSNVLSSCFQYEGKAINLIITYPYGKFFLLIEFFRASSKMKMAQWGFNY